MHVDVLCGSEKNVISMRASNWRTCNCASKDIASSQNSLCARGVQLERSKARRCEHPHRNGPECSMAGEGCRTPVLAGANISKPPGRAKIVDKTERYMKIR